VTDTPPPRPATRRRDAERTRASILSAATREFGAHGFSGGRIERIAKTARCNIRLLYHYFGNKKALYIAVLEGAYADLREQQAALDFDLGDPLGSIERLLRFTFTYFDQNPYFEGLLRAENMMRGKFVTQSTRVPEEAARLNARLRQILQAGEEQRVIRPGIDPAQLYVTIAALSRFHLANAYTLSAMLDVDAHSAEWRVGRLEHSVELLRDWLTTGASASNLQARQQAAVAD
jgi:AcrR family transcriptional regulator